MGLLAWIAPAQAQIFGAPQTQVFAPSRLLQKVGIDQKVGAEIPLDLAFTDESGQPVTLRTYFGKPVILALVYYQCPSLCNMVLNGVLRAAKDLPMTAGDQYQIVAVSFDPRETPEMAAAKKQTYLKGYSRPGAEQGWHFLTGQEGASKTLADAVGFNYVYDSMTNQYAHGSAIMLLTPVGRVARYFYGIDYPARDLRLGLVEASNGGISSPTDQILLYCYHFDPASGKYALVIMNVHDHQGVLAAGRVVVVAVQQDLVRRRADPAIGRFHQPQAQIARRIVDSVEIPRHPAHWRQQHDGAAVRILVGHGVVDVVEADGVGQGLASPFLTGEEVPALFSARAAVTFQIRLLLGRGHLGRLARIETDGDNLVLIPRGHRQVL